MIKTNNPRRIFLAFILAISIPSLALAQALNVSAAISLRESLDQIAKDYNQQTGREISMQYGASGQLASQIKQGAPIDLFISADQQSVDTLTADKTADAETIRPIVSNDLVLIAPAGAKIKPTDFADLADPKFKRISIGEPKTVPAGRYAMQVLDSLKLTDALKDRLVFGTNVRQVLSYVERGEVDAGIVYKTDALQSGDKVEILETADPASHKPIVYPAVVIQSSKNRESAIRFLDYLLSDPAQKVFAAKGFSPPQAGSK